MSSVKEFIENNKAELECLMDIAHKKEEGFELVDKLFYDADAQILLATDGVRCAWIAANIPITTCYCVYKNNNLYMVLEKRPHPIKITKLLEKTTNKKDYELSMSSDVAYLTHRIFTRCDLEKEYFDISLMQTIIDHFKDRTFVTYKRDTLSPFKMSFGSFTFVLMPIMVKD